MQWLGIGDWDAYMELPYDIVAEAIHLMHYEHNEREQASRHYDHHARTKGKTPKYKLRDYVSPLSLPPEKPKEQATIIDEQGHKRVVREKPDGTVVRHREIADGDLVMWSVFGVPKSFRGKTNLADAVRKPKSDGD